MTLEKFSKLKAPLLKFCKENNIKGTILLGAEGINGTVSGPREGIDAFRHHFDTHPQLGGRIDYKESEHDGHPFYRLKIKIKREIVTLGRQGIDPLKKVGTYVSPAEWNALIQDPDVILVDTRNIYEYDVGTFKGAINPNTINFREFPDYVAQNLDPAKHKRVATFCTGGIRCEKATSYLLEQGFEKVYHLKGGILKYLEEVPEDDSLWEGECFVFDNRVTVNHQLEKGTYDMCHACRHPISATDKQHPHYQLNVSCPHCHETQTPRNRERATERAKQMQLAKTKGISHIGE